MPCHAGLTVHPHIALGLNPHFPRRFIVNIFPTYTMDCHDSTMWYFSWLKIMVFHGNYASCIVFFSASLSCHLESPGHNTRSLHSLSVQYVLCLVARVSVVVHLGRLVLLFLIYPPCVLSSLGVFLIPSSHAHTGSLALYVIDRCDKVSLTFSVCAILAFS